MTTSLPVNGKKLPEKMRRESDAGRSELKKLTSAAREAAVKNLPARLLAAGDFASLIELLTDLEFLEEKVSAGLISELISDLETAFARVPEGVGGRYFLFLIARTLRFDFDFLRAHPDRFFQCAWNRCWWHDNPEAEKHYPAPPEGWNEENAPWKRPGDKIYLLVDKWREIYERRENSSWLRAMTPPAMTLDGLIAGVFDFRKQGGVSFVCAHPGAAGNMIVLDGSGVISVWEMDSSVAVECFNEDDISSDEFDFAGAGDYEVLGYIKNDYREKLTRILLWSPGSGFRIYRYESPAVFLSKRLGKLFSAQENKIYSLDLAAGDNSFLCEMHGDNKFIYCMAVDEQNARIITGASDDRLCGYDLNSGEKYFETRFASSLSRIILHPGMSDFITLHNDRSFYLWNAEFGRVVREFAGHRKFVTAAVIDCARGRILSSSNDGTVREWDLAGSAGGGFSVAGGGAAIEGDADKREGLIVVSSPGALQDLALFDGGRRIITVSQNSVVSVWFASSSGVPAGPALKKRAAINSVDRSDDGKTYFTHHDDDALVFWNAETGAADSEIEAPVNGPIVQMSFIGPDSLIIVGREKAGIRSITLVNTTGRKVVLNRRFDEKYKGYLFDNDQNQVFIMREDCFCVLDLAKNEIEELFKLDYRFPDGRVMKIVSTEPRGDAGSSMSHQLCFEVPDAFMDGYCEKFFIFDAAEKKVIFDYCKPGHVVSERTLIGAYDLLYFYTVKKPELKLLDWPPPDGQPVDKAMPAEQLFDQQHFRDTFTHAAKDAEFNFMRLSDHKIVRVPFTAHYIHSCLGCEDLMIIVDHVDPRVYKPAAGVKFEVILFDLVKLTELMRFSLPLPVIDFNSECPGFLLLSLADGPLAVMSMVELKITTIKLFDNYISEMIYIAKKLYLLTDSKGYSRLFDIKMMSAVDCGEYMIGGANIIFENDRGGLEMLTCGPDGFSRSTLAQCAGVESSVIRHSVLGGVTDMAFIGGRYYCVVDGKTLRVSDEAGNCLETLDLMNAVISAAGEDKILSTGDARTLFSSSGRHLMYFLNYKLKAVDCAERQAILLYDIAGGGYEVNHCLNLYGDNEPGVITPFHITPEKRIYLMRTNPDGQNEYGSLLNHVINEEGFFIYDFKRNHIGKIDFDFLFGYDFTKLAIDARGVYLAKARPYGQILITDLREGEKISHDTELNEHYYPITSMYFTRDDKYLITRSLDGMTIRWRTGSWEKVETICEPYPIFKFIPEHEDDRRGSNSPEKPDYLCFAAEGDEAVHYNMRLSLDSNVMDYIDRPGDGNLIVIGDNDKLHFISMKNGGLQKDKNK